MALGLPTSGDDCHQVAAASPLVAFAVVDIGDVETDPAGDLADQPQLKPVVVWNGKS